MRGRRPVGPERWYRRLLRIFPASFRRRHGKEMVRSFLRLLELEGERKGFRGRVAVWIGATADAVRRGLALRLPGRAPHGGGRRAGGKASRPASTADGAAGTGRAGGTTGVMATLGDLASDARFALRALRRRPVFALTAVLALALGIGATTAIFSVVNGILLKPMPYEEPGRLVALWAAHPERGWSRTDVSMPEAWEWGRRSDALAAVIVHDNGQVALTGGDRPEMADAVFTTPNIFEVLGVKPALGRGFVLSDNEEGAQGVVVLSHDFWRARFGGDRDVLGETVVVDGDPHTVVGVLPEGFYYADEFADLFVPWRRDPATAPRGSFSDEAVARLAPGATVEQARAELARIARQQEEAHPEDDEGWRAEVVPLRRDVAGDVATRASVVLMAAAGFILLMACVNVANLLLARANGRRREIAIRAAMGAGRGRVVRQLLVESGLLAGTGGILGLGLSVWATHAIVSRLPAFTPPVLRFGMDWRVLAFTAAATAGAVVLFGLTPALRASRVDPDALGEGGRGGGAGRRSRRFGSTLVVVQTAVAMLLLVAGGVLLRSVAAMRSLDLGYETEGILAVGLDPPERRYPDGEALAALYEELDRRVRAVPGVEEVGWIHSPPLGGANWSAGVRIPGVEVAGEDEGLPVRVDYVTPGYLETMGISVLRGRGFRESDREDAPEVVLVNQVFVDRYLDGRDALSHSVDAGDDSLRSIVGVVEPTVERDVDRGAEPTVFAPLAQEPTRRRYLMVRTAGAPAALAETLRRAIWEVDPELPFVSARTMEELVAMRVAGFALIAQLMGGFAVLALLLGGVGIYGVTSYAVSQRTNEIGVRMAMGARRGQVLGLVVREGIVRAAIGLGAGVVLAFLLTRGLESFLVGVSASDPLTFGGVAVVLGAAAVLAAYLPARRASAIDPVRALAQE